MQLCCQYLHCLIRKAELLLDPSDPRLIQVGVDRHAITIFEEFHQVVFVKVEAAGQIVQADTPLEVFVKVVLDRLDIKCI